MGVGLVEIEVVLEVVLEDVLEDDDEVVPDTPTEAVFEPAASPPVQTVALRYTCEQTEPMSLL